MVGSSLAASISSGSETLNTELGNENAAAVTFLANSNALNIDLRKNGGGTRQQRRA